MRESREGWMSQRFGKERGWREKGGGERGRERQREGGGERERERSVSGAW